ncbi:unnamed protein product [Knipowitschia caucasica]
MDLRFSSDLDPGLDRGLFKSKEPKSLKSPSLDRVHDRGLDRGLDQDRAQDSGLDSGDHRSSSSVDPDYCRRILVRDAKGSIREIILPKGLDLDRPKRTRTSFTAEQLYRLELEFQRCQYVVGRERTELARQLNLSETQVKVWFQNRRTKQKKDQGKDSDLRSVSESAATCSVLRLLEQGRLLPPLPPSLPPHGPGLPPLLPHAMSSALRLHSDSSSGSSPPPRPGSAQATPPSLFGFPSLLGGVASRVSAPLSLAGNLHELSARYLSASAFEPYSRREGKEETRKQD